MTDANEARWVFGYGSLMWRPGFAYLNRQAAVLHGRRRAFCIYSVHHRGTAARPGLVLGLVPGGAVRGIAYQISPQDWPSVHAYLLEREQPTETYVEARVTVRLTGSVPIRATTFLSDTGHPQWAGALSLSTQADLIAGATGLSGRNIDYLRDLIGHLAQEGIVEKSMRILLGYVETLMVENTHT